MTNVIALTEQVKAIHPKSGKPVTVVGVDTSSFTPRLIVLHRSVDGIYAEVIDDAILPVPSVAA